MRERKVTLTQIETLTWTHYAPPQLSEYLEKGKPLRGCSQVAARILRFLNFSLEFLNIIFLIESFSARKLVNSPQQVAQSGTKNSLSLLTSSTITRVFLAARRSMKLNSVSFENNLGRNALLLHTIWATKLLLCSEKKLFPNQTKTRKKKKLNEMETVIKQNVDYRLRVVRLVAMALVKPIPLRRTWIDRWGLSQAFLPASSASCRFRYCHCCYLHAYFYLLPSLLSFYYPRLVHLRLRRPAVYWLHPSRAALLR